ncbi:hypothetical protein IWX85_000332 [Polaromonas sp. CG_9.11]|nr:hypothetical protein [Polaromonas sp. CG_9.11]
MMLKTASAGCAFLQPFFALAVSLSAVSVLARWLTFASIKPGC